MRPKTPYTMLTNFTKLIEQSVPAKSTSSYDPLLGYTPLTFKFCNTSDKPVTLIIGIIQEQDDDEPYGSILEWLDETQRH